MAPRDLAKLGCALALGIALAFPAGMFFAGRGEPERRPRAETDAEHRQVFSPEVLDDPHFRAQQRRNVEALERHCRESGELCPEAEGARAWLEGAGD